MGSAWATSLWRGGLGKLAINTGGNQCMASLKRSSPEVIGRELDRFSVLCWGPLKWMKRSSRSPVLCVNTHVFPSALSAHAIGVTDAGVASTFAPCVAIQTRMSETDLWDHRRIGSGINGALRCFATKVSCTVDAKDHAPTEQLFWIHSLLLVSALAMAGKGGRYALEAAGGALDSETNLILVQAARVREYREKFLLQADEDFAFAFRNISEARSAGGDYLAMEWARVRALEEERLVPQAAAVVEAGPSASSGYSFRSPTGRGDIAPIKRQGVTLVPNDSDPEIIMRRVQSLTDVFYAAGTLKPQGTLDHDMEQEWLTELRRMAQHLVTKSDKATIVNAVRTFAELSWFLMERKRPFPPEELDLRSFLATGTAGPVRAVNSLRWISKNGLLRWPVDNIGQVQLSTSRKVRRNCQAVVVEPPMMSHLEAAIIEQHRLGNENWRRLLGSWLVANGCLRYRHIALSTPTKLTLSCIYAHCARGKQTHNRRGFSWVAPARFANGFSWAEFWMKDYTQLPHEVSLRSGFCFADNGVPYTISEVQQGARDIFTGLVEPLEALTTYSFRRVLPTVANMLNYTDTERLALGDWTDKDTGAAAMPSHYAAAKQAQAMKSKHRAYNAVQLLESYESWEMVPYGALEQVDVLAKQRTNKAVGQDSTVLWELPPDAEKLSLHFRLAKELTDAAAKARAKPPSNHPAMPATYGAYILTQTMKSGSLLCTNYNVGSCPNDEKDCEGRHLCAVVLQTGRACGGKHPASECWGRRAMTAKRFKDLPSGAAAPSEAAGENQAEETAKVTDSESSSEWSGVNPQSSVPEPSEPPAAQRVPEPKEPPKGHGVPRRSNVVSKAKEEKNPKAEKEMAPTMPKKKARPAPAPSAADEPKTKKAKAEVQLPIPQVESLDPDENRFDKLATVKGKTTEAPSMVLQLNNGGALWISGLPTEKTKRHFPKVDLQVCCMVEEPEARGGITLPGAHLVMLPLTGADRDDHWKACWPLIRNTLFQGDVVLTHCVAGRHRAAVGGTVMVACMQQTGVSAAEATVLARRPIQLQEAFKNRHLASWAHATVRSTRLGNPFPKGWGWAATERSHVHVVGADKAPLCTFKQGSNRPRFLKDPEITQDKQLASDWGLPFCAACRERCSASFLF